MNRLKGIPYGISDFNRLRNDNFYFVDKTIYLPLIERMPSYLSLTRPRRFGKSLFLSMMRTYYDLLQRDNFDRYFGDLWIGAHPTDQREQNQRQTVVVGEGIQPVEQIAERDTDEIGQAGCVFRLGSGSLGRSGGLHVHIFIVRADRTGGTAGHGQHEHGGKDPDQDFFLHCFPPSVMGIRVQTTGKNHAALRHRVKIVSLIKGIAPQQPLQRQPAALERPVFCNRLERILRTGR